MSLLLEYRYSKDQLLEAYINEVYLGQHFANGIYGFGLASEFYFGENIFKAVKWNIFIRKLIEDEN